MPRQAPRRYVQPGRLVGQNGHNRHRERDEQGQWLPVEPRTLDEIGALLRSNWDNPDRVPDEDRLLPVDETRRLYLKAINGLMAPDRWWEERWGRWVTSDEMVS